MEYSIGKTYSQNILMKVVSFKTVIGKLCGSCFFFFFNL